MELKNKPLVEAIFELQWELKNVSGNIMMDPHYKILIGAIYEKIKKEYPIHEPLPAASMPDEMTGYVVQHRFRKTKDGWPVVQIGPGIIAVNETAEYTWNDFEKRISQYLNVLFDVYPNAKENLKVNKIKLRYINAVDVDFSKEDFYTFLKEKMKVDIKMHDGLFERKIINKSPKGFNLRFAFEIDNPKGTVQLRLGNGKKEGNNVLIWETTVISDGNGDKKGVEKWTREAHEIIEDWFFKIIEGDLQKQFE